ncbi:MAG: ileS [Candidatus Saccharibacteria bacterium]|nr:ileS [Candidatus Saccharibacteria bacterium]
MVPPLRVPMDESFYFWKLKRMIMKFKANTRRRAAEYEKDIIRYWKDNKTFEKSIANRPTDNSYVFYDGPPFITGVPHHGTLLSSVVKDAIPRYQTMKGKHVERVWGWDTHGLPAENFVEKKLGITDRHEIGTRISLEEYITTARESMIETGGLWESTIDRIGRWVDFKGAYKTMDKDYMESVWWAFKQLYEKGKIYEGERVLMYDTKWATPLSKAEVTMDAGAYVEVTDPSVYTKFKVKDKDEYYRRIVAPNEMKFMDESDEARTKTRLGNIDRTPDVNKAKESGDNVYFLAWTTTPWTLPANTALATSYLLDYSEVKVGNERFIVADDLIEKVFVDEKHQPIEYEVTVSHFSGLNLVGLEYEPLFEDRGENAHKVWDAEYVDASTGTGIVHLAPAYGEEDFILAKEKGIPIVHVLDEYGVYNQGPWEGLEVWENNKLIAKTLLEQGVVWKIDYIRHEYPHNPRTGHRLMYRAHPSWFMDIDGQRTEMLEENSEHVNWFPGHIKHGRFEKTIETAPDWNLSRDRFWATAMPVWKGSDSEGNEHIKVVGSYAELKELSGVELDDYHRPWVDDIAFDLDGVHYTRIDKVLDCWFESGSMPFAQFHYPFENVEKFEQNFPGDFIVEYIGQVRAWFYYVHAVNVGLFGHNAFKNVIVTGNVAGNDGRKMSKSLGNFTDPNELMDKFSADSLRFLLLSSPLLSGEDFALQDKEVGDVARKLSMIWNMYDFFTLYAEVDGWEFDGQLKDPSEFLENPLDQWIISRIHQLIEEIEKNLDAYDVATAMKPILPFIDDASNWYVRRSRRRFWKSDDDGDKDNAYRTLHYVLVRLSQAIAPFVPFLAEELYRNLTGEESVHLTDWPEVGHVNELVVKDMETVRDYVNQALSLRAGAGLKIRQPLALMTVPTLGEFVSFEDILTEELNVKKVIVRDALTLDFEITPELKREGLSREVIRHVQSARKEAGLNVDDRIELVLTTDNAELSATLKAFADEIGRETLTSSTVLTGDAYETSVKIDGAVLAISLRAVA